MQEVCQSRHQVIAIRPTRSALVFRVLFTRAETGPWLKRAQVCHLAQRIDVLRRRDTLLKSLVFFAGVPWFVVSFGARALQGHLFCQVGNLGSMRHRVKRLVFCWQQTRPAENLEGLVCLAHGMHVTWV